ncbi:hypothetical protein [Prevotella lacticifex]|uniref:Uncharacterized protein n=1 Tax=Prevotella lacticifex TaxID=2854755 RepID=A0A9R1C760_9BACT|nr:hypothetical protein [Prevotella lacticifex]GJG37014.1 hypothetical protein PRLR5003_21710 [Prevotella lacticifex]GJG40486.1 hypothetical protein PRLR5019_24570 [Prevotella lacticifex]GJG44183.1 hypothetical protein PRLR5025_29690 [Prevotella lacticifex]GJG46868.1 hypothetical protein PRLR5027_24630 [Prevotella lacticifex]GJG50512.1 hypothetical protein PRLR5052_29250 [Prevotella lacticifex]
MNLRKKISTVIIAGAALAHTAVSTAQSIDRRPIVERNNPHTDRIDTLASLTVGNGRFALTVDATGMQSFPEYYRGGIPLGTFSEWGWHSMPNSKGYRAADALEKRDFGRGHKELYAVQPKAPGRQHDAAEWLRANPQRMHLGCIGFDIPRPELVGNVSQRLDMWTGKITSDFDCQGHRYHVETVCHPRRDLIAVRIASSTIPNTPSAASPMALRLRIPYPTGGHSDDGCNWNADKKRFITIKKVAGTAASDRLRIAVDSSDYFIDLRYVAENQGKRRITIDNTAKECRIPMAETGELICEFAPEEKALGGLGNMDFDDVAEASAAFWKDYWTRGGIVDLSATDDARARELERRIVQSIYLLAVNDRQNFPPAETGLTYNSWFGKFHLEMIYWHQAWQALWGHAADLERSLDWYFRAAPMAREIAARQGFGGVRWMKMTDPSAAEAPSNVGSYLIWQQPHLIYLANLLYRAAKSKGDTADASRILRKFGPLVEATAEFMYDFAGRDSVSGKYFLSGYIPAQETLKASTTRNSPFELSYWLTAMKIAQQWRRLAGKDPHSEWDSLISGLPSLPSKSGIYLTAEGAPLIGHRAAQTDTPVGDDRYASDHPMPLGALGMMPCSRLMTQERMDSTYNWTIANWNWQKTWGWDYPMTAMCATRLHRPDDAVGALLMPVAKNTYLPQGHNWQTPRLRCYLPGNGGLLLAVALMAAGWDGCTTPDPGFPPAWKVRYEGILPLP